MNETGVVRTPEYLSAYDLGSAFASRGNNAEQLEAEAKLSGLSRMLEGFGEHSEFSRRAEFQHAMGFLHGVADVLGLRSYWEGSIDCGVHEIEIEDLNDAQDD